MSFPSLTFVIAVILAAEVPRSLAAETLRIASPQRGSWEGAIPELGKEAGIFQKQGLDLDILYTQGGGETLVQFKFLPAPLSQDQLSELIRIPSGS